MLDKLQALDLLALQIDDLALQLRSLGMEDVAKHLETARDAVPAICASGDVSAALVAGQEFAS
jgi:hypothetical protein